MQNCINTSLRCRWAWEAVSLAPTPRMRAVQQTTHLTRQPNLHGEPAKKEKNGKNTHSAPWRIHGEAMAYREQTQTQYNAALLMATRKPIHTHARKPPIRRRSVRATHTHTGHSVSRQSHDVFMQIFCVPANLVCLSASLPSPSAAIQSNRTAAYHLRPPRSAHKSEQQLVFACRQKI